MSVGRNTRSRLMVGAAAGLSSMALGAGLLVASTSTAVTSSQIPTITADGSHAIAPAAFTCNHKGGIFKPTSAAVSGVGTYGVYWAQRHADGTMGTPPLTNTGKWQFGWDAPGWLPAGYPPAQYKGAVSFDAHTYPNAAGTGMGPASAALGNLLYTKLFPGHYIWLRSSNGPTACFKVVSRTNYWANQVPAATYSYSGRYRLTITICSGKRLGPGRWDHRTVWVLYAV
jgi:hypothetical protein